MAPRSAWVILGIWSSSAFLPVATTLAYRLAERQSFHGMRLRVSLKRIPVYTEPMQAPQTKRCERCEGEFFPRRSDARFCAPKCRLAAFRARRKVREQEAATLPNRLRTALERLGGGAQG
jgi:hypothetical protein